MIIPICDKVNHEVYREEVHLHAIIDTEQEYDIQRILKSIKYRYYKDRPNKFLGMYNYGKRWDDWEDIDEWDGSAPVDKEIPDKLTISLYKSIKDYEQGIVEIEETSFNPNAKKECTFIETYY